MGERYIDLTGQRFGKLTVVDYCGTGKNGGALWRCRCDCGNEKVVIRRSLIKGETKSCGCSNLWDLTGMRFGKLTVLEYVGSGKDCALWKCKCDCGNMVVFSTQRLKKGKIKNCGCTPKVDLTGQKVGLLTVLSFAEKDKYGQAKWNCKCDCGNEIIVGSAYLKNSKVANCGCKRTKLTNKTRSYERIYQAWKNFKKRCFNKNNNDYKNYGGRGITVCEEWRTDFQAFYDWAMQNGYSDDLTIDRIDVNGNYEPSNCRWATRKEQGNNRRDNVRITHNGETHTIAEWSRITGLSRDRVRKELASGLLLFGF